jgi:aminoglycoside 3-N-acetyltransferase
MIDALLDVLGPEGTLVVPTFTEENSKTSSAHRRRIQGLDARQVAEFRAAMPAFDPATTPATTGALGEQVRLMPGALRSIHPQTSFAALGPLAQSITGHHASDCHHGEDSPMARLYEAGARVLLIGVGYEVCSALHLAEYRVPDPPRRIYECVVATNEGKRWYAFESVELISEDFATFGKALDVLPVMVKRGYLGFAPTRLLPLPATVDFAVRWFTSHRKGNAGGTPAEGIS